MKYTQILLILTLGICISCGSTKHKRTQKSTKKEVKTDSVDLVNEDIKLDSLIDTKEVTLGDTFDIKLQAQFSTGKGWTPTDTIDQLELISHTAMPMDTGKFSFRDIQVWKYCAKDTGSYELKFDYKRPWIKDQAPDSTHQFTIIVK